MTDPRPIPKFRRCKNTSPHLAADAQRLEKPGCDQNGNIVRLTAQHPSRLFNGQPRRRMPQQNQKLMLIVSHWRMPKTNDQIPNKFNAGPLPDSR
jgi:hypothetical protein